MDRKDVECQAMALGLDPFPQSLGMTTTAGLGLNSKKKEVLFQAY